MRSIIAVLVTSLFVLGSDESSGQERATLRRPLRIALYPYVPGKEGMYWRVEREFEAANPLIDMQYVDTASNYYGGQIRTVLLEKKVDIAEIDTVLLEDLVEDGCLAELPASCVPVDSFFPHSTRASFVEGKLYGVPHWVCGNFLFFRTDDPEVERFRALDSLDDLERILGRPVSSADTVMVDMRGSSTLGEKYLDALLDKFQSVEGVLEALESTKLDEETLRNLDRLFSLCPGGLCDSDKHHEYGEFYARQFAARQCRALIGYSERMYYVVDHYLHGIRDGSPSIGRIDYPADNDYKALGQFDVDVVPAALSDNGQKMLSWVDVLAVRSNLDEQTRKDALGFVEFFNSEGFSIEVLVPEYGKAPRYLLPARKSVYQNEDLLKSAPLYRRFAAIMGDSTAVSDDDLNSRLRAIGKTIEERGFMPVLEH